MRCWFYHLWIETIRYSSIGPNGLNPWYFIHYKCLRCLAKKVRRIKTAKLGKEEGKNMIWKAKRLGVTREHLGLIPFFLSEEDPRPAREQVDSRYISGWHSFPGFTLLPNGDLKYPGDPPTKLLAETKLRDETIRFYDHSWLLIMQKDGSWEVSRVD